MGPGFKRRKLTPKVEEVNFDDTARQDFLTGFRKRKQQRIKHAQGVAEKRAREERVQDRKKLREERSADFKRVMEEHKRQLQRLKDEDNSDSDSNPDQDDNEDQEWEGFAEPPVVDYEAEYIDEDKYTTVTVEEMDASREGLRKSVQHDGDSEEDNDGEKDPSAPSTTEPEAKPTKKARKSQTDKPKKKKKQFRYESKGDRKLTIAKQRLSKSRKAQARREG